MEYLLLLALVAALGLAVTIGWSRLRSGLQNSHTRLWLRLRLRLHPGPGFANRWELWRRYGLARARKTARHGRPSLTRRDMYGRGAWRQYATFLGWGQGWLHRWRVYATYSDIVITIAAPQKGKSAAAAGRIIDAPGPVVVTSIRGDLIANTAGLRQQLGTLHVFNPEGVGEYGSTFRWDPVAGCDDMQTAIRRAGHMVAAVEAGGLSDSNFWSDQAVQVIASYMHAAGLLKGATMLTVYRWIASRSPVPANVILTTPGAADMAGDAIQQFQALNDRTRESIETTCRNVLKFMISPEVAQALTPDPDMPGFVIGDFLQSRDTLYLVASAESGSPIPPLLCALLAEIKHEAVLFGASQPAGRLDPPLSMELDEVANVTPIPVPAWASYAAGSGIRLSIYTQSWGQLVGRWGANAAETLWQTATCKIIMSGTSERDLLARVSALCGRTQVTTGHVTRDGKRTPIKEWVDVLPTDAVRRLPPGRAVVVLDAGLPTIVRTEQVWKRADVKRWRKSGQPISLPPQGLPVLQPLDPELDDSADLSITAAADPVDLAARRAQRLEDVDQVPAAAEQTQQSNGLGWDLPEGTS